MEKMLKFSAYTLKKYQLLILQKIQNKFFFFTLYAYNNVDSVYEYAFTIVHLPSH